MTTHSTLRRSAALALAATFATSLVATTTAQAAPAAKPVTVPKQVALKAKDFSVYQRVGYDSGQYANQPAAGGQYCDISDNGAAGTEARPVAGRQWFWYDTRQGNPVGVDTTHIVTVWADGAGALADLQNDTGYCRLGEGWTVTEATATTFEAQGGSVAIASRLVGNTLVSVTVSDWSFVTLDPAAEAERLADIAAAKVAKNRKLP